MEETIKNYPTRTDGAAVLREFALDNDDKPTWPECFIQHWESVKAKARANLDSWKAQSNCALDQHEKEDMLYDLQVRVYIGFMINDVALKTKAFCNNHVNKHWPTTLKSGECPSALLQAIRHYYHDDVVAKEKASNVVKTWKSTRTKNKLETTDKQIADKNAEALKTYKFTTDWYPEQWLTWVLYGPPEALHRSEFHNLSMLHLRQMKAAPRELTEKELVNFVETQSKIVRRQGRGKNALHLDSDDEDEKRSANTQQTKSHSVVVTRELKLPAPTANSFLDQAINAKTSMVDMLRRRDVNDSRIDELNDEIYELLNKKAAQAMKEFERYENM